MLKTLNQPLPPPTGSKGVYLNFEANLREWAGFSARFHTKILPVGVEIFEMNRRHNLEHKQATRNFAEKFDRRTTTRWVGYDLPCQIMITPLSCQNIEEYNSN